MHPALSSWRVAAAALLAALPWLNPFAHGPSATVQPWLVSMACALALWLVAATGSGPARLRFAWPVGIITLWAVLSQQSLRPEVVFLAAGLLLVALAASLVDDAQMTQGLQIGLLLAAVVSAGIGLLQYFGLAGWFWPWISRADTGEAYANLRQPNQYATLAWIGAAVLLWGTVRVRLWLALLLVVLLAVASAASVSRTGMVEGLVLVLLAGWWRGPQRRRRFALCAAAAAAYIGAAWLLPVLLEATGALPLRTLLDRLAGAEGCSSRVVLWSNVLHLIALKPLAGWGWGELDYAHFVTLYDGPRFCDILDNAHNLPLHLAVELGVPAAVLLCALALAWAWRQRPWQEQAPLRQLAWALAALVLLHSLLEYPLWYGPFQIAFGAAVGWLAPPRAPPEARTLHAPSATLAALLLAGTGFAAWDYDRVSQIYLPPEQRRAAWREGTLEHVRRSWLFAGQAGFADLTLDAATQANAPRMHALANRTLHYSPEPRVIERAIESATLLGREEEAVLQLARYRAAFPLDYEAWRQARQLAPPAGGLR